MVDEPIEPKDPLDSLSDPEPDPEPGPGPEPKKFSDMTADEQKQFLFSGMGRLVDRQISEKVLPEIQKMMPALQSEPQPQMNFPAGSQEEMIKKVNEQLQERIFSGDVMGAFNIMSQVQERARQTLSQRQFVSTEKELIAYSNQPYYKDVFPEMKKIAVEAAGQGYPPKIAALVAYNKAIADRALKRTTAPKNLDMLKGGSPQKRISPSKLPDQFKQQAQRDIDKGIFKNEKEYIDNLSPAIRAKYSI